MIPNVCFLRRLYALCIAMILLCASGANAAVWYITQDGAGAKNGASWAAAYGEADFPSVIASAEAGDELHVAKGVYRPAIPSGAPTSDDRNATFTLKNGVAIYGGFAGGEATVADRDPAANLTILTGDLAGDDTDSVGGVTSEACDIAGTNSLHVVTGSDADATAILDGFTITAGNANGDAYPDNRGGGIFNGATGAPIIMNCVFSGNAAENGGGMYNDTISKPTVTHCTFTGNASTFAGGGMHSANGSEPAVTDCAFSGNTAGTRGGGMHNFQNAAIVTGCTFSGNSAGDGGGMCNSGNSQPIVTNCTFSVNAATQNGGGMYNLDSVATVINCTFFGNVAVSGSGIYCTLSGNFSEITNCILWDASGGEVWGAPTLKNCVVSGDYPGGSEIVTDNPNIGPLAWNGGATRTHALPADSSAVNAGTNDLPFSVAVSDDQRGVARPQGASFDIGAYEYWSDKILTIHTEGHGAVERSPAGAAVGTSAGSWRYPAGTHVELTASPGARGFFREWSGDATGSYGVVSLDISPDRYAEAIFDPAWIIAASAGTGGDIDPSGDVKVMTGADRTFTVSPNAGYFIADVVVDGVSIGSASTHTFPNVSRDHAIEASFAPEPTAAPTAVPTTNPTSTPAPTATPTPVPTPDPRIPLPTVTLKITLYAGGTLVAGPFDITDPATLSGLLSSPTLLAQLLATDPAAILSGQYNMDLVRFFSLVADLDDGVLDFTILFEIQVEGVPAGYRAQLFMLTRTFDAQGNPTGYSVVPRFEGENVFRKGRTARGWTETWRVTVRDGGASDGDARQDGSVAPQIAAVVAVFPMATPTVTVTPTRGSTGSGGGCAIPANGSAALAALLLLAPVVLMRRL